jgi:hypothetical protein
MVCGVHLFVLSNDHQAGLEPAEAVVVVAVAAVAAAVMVTALRNGSKFSV